MSAKHEGMTTCLVEAEEAGLRLDVFLARRVASLTRSRLRKAIDAGDVLVDGHPKKASAVVETGQTITLRLLAREQSHLEPVAFPLDIIFEDEHLIVLNKPAGLTVHPGAGTEDEPTLVQALLHHGARLESSDDSAVDRPGIVHRLDKDTTGVMVVAKSEIAHAALSRQFHDKTNRREYVALLDGVLSHRDVVRESYLFRDPHSRVRFNSVGRDTYETQLAGAPPAPSHRLAVSHFSTERTFLGRLTLARVTLKTGRTHQIRLHARDLGAPVIGDLVYHRPCQLPASFPPEVKTLLGSLERQMLHARLLGFTHPVTGNNLSFEAPLPADFQSALDRLAPLADAAL
jgi:23S rRNA pseudouridine1911/1915/1917 synthase